MKRLLFCLLLFFPLFSFAETATIVLFDISRSVPPEDFQMSKVLVRGLLEQKKPNDVVEIYAFGNSYRKVEPEDLDALQATESNTLLFDAAYDAAQKLVDVSADRKAIVIISDGKDTKSATILEDTAAFVNNHGIAIHGIGVGDAQRKTLERI